MTIPVKAIRSGSDVTSLGEFTSSDTVPVANGGTGSTTASAARTALGVALDGPRFRAYPAADFLITSGALTGITLNTENFDVGGHFNAGTNRFQPTVPGYYQINAAITFASSTATLSHAIGYLYKNTAAYAVAQQRAPVIDVFGVNVSDVVYLNGSTDYVLLQGVGIASSGTITILGGGAFTFLSGHFIGA